MSTNLKFLLIAGGVLAASPAFAQTDRPSLPAKVERVAPPAKPEVAKPEVVKPELTKPSVPTTKPAGPLRPVQLPAGITPPQRPTAVTLPALVDRPQ